MPVNEPLTELDKQFSSEGATATSWPDARAILKKAEIYWLSTVRADGRPHVTPLVAFWTEGALYFSTGSGERKAKNLAHNASCVITTGCNAMSKGLDVVIEGSAAIVSDPAKLQRVADGFSSKYGDPFRFKVKDFALHGEGGEALLYELIPAKAFGYGRGGAFSATRWRF